MPDRFVRITGTSAPSSIQRVSSSGVSVSSSVAPGFSLRPAPNEL